MALVKVSLILEDGTIDDEAEVECDSDEEAAAIFEQVDTLLSEVSESEEGDEGGDGEG